MIKYIVDLLKNPSTYAGFSGLALAAGLSAPEYAAISNALAGVFALVAIFLP